MQIFDRVRVVLVNSAQPGNIGGAARAMLNMGLTRLYLVDPEVFPSDRAVWRAAGATQILDNAQVFARLEDAVADCQLVIGTSARERRIQWPLVDPKECVSRMFQEPPDTEIALVFGREHSGLTNGELQQCHWHVHIPSNADYSSLNLCAAVQVVAYELRMQHLQQQGELPLPQEWDEPLATNKQLEMLIQHFEQAMTTTGFFDPEKPRQTMTRLRRMLTRIRADESEVAILRGFLASAEREISGKR